MTENLSHSEIQELLGAYALDAVDTGERAIIEAHIPTCESCRLELDDHRRLAETLRRHAVRVRHWPAANRTDGHNQQTR